MSETFNPDWRYAKMTRTEIEERVKARSSLLLSRRHIIPESSGRKINYEININGRILFLNIREDKTYKMVRLHSITDKIQTTATLQ